MIKKNQLFLLGSLFLVSGCATYSLEELRRVEPVGTEFQKALSRSYKEFAISEERQYDWVDSMHFADKGLMAAYGKDVEPEALASWNIPQDKLPELVLAREALVKVLEEGAAESKPEIAARAQYYFDCWVEQQEEAWQLADIAYCRDGFMDTMETLLGAPLMPKKEAVTEPEEAQPTTAKESVVAPKEAPVSNNNLPATTAKNLEYTVFFESKQAEISASGKKVIEEILGLADQGGDYTFVLNSHTDTVGDALENQKLTQERAEVVREALVKGGVDSDDIRIFAFGESDPPVKTADEIEEPANQRVEILLNE